MNSQQRHKLLALMRSDLFRYMQGDCSFKAAARAYRVVPGFRFMVWQRIAFMTRASTGAWRIVHFFARAMHKHYRFKFGISIPCNVEIGRGFYIGHFGGIVINEAAVIGCNCNISHGVTIGQQNRGRRKGVPTIGNEAYIGPGAKIIGNIRIGNGCAIGANAVVTSDLPDNAVAVGAPARIISFEGSTCYVEFCDYSDEL